MMKISYWRRIALLAAGISASVVSTAWGQNLYQTHSDGSIWQYTGPQCNRVSCPGWVELDNNPSLSMIATGGGALFEMHQDGSIWWYVGPACSQGLCPGWVELDNNPMSVAIGAGTNGTPYEVHQDGSLWEYNGVVCTDGTCPGWTELQTDSTQGGVAFQAHYGVNGAILAALNQVDNCNFGNLSVFGGTPNSWTEIDQNGYRFAVGATSLYEFELGGEIRQYNPPPAGDWLTIDHNVATTYIAAGGSGLYKQQQQDGNLSMFQYNGTPCNGTTCPGWVKIDNHPGTLVPVVGSNAVYQIRETPSASGPPGPPSIWQYTGTPCSGTVCSGWVPLDDNPSTTSIVAGPVTFPAYLACGAF
jgi:hypothetical protein